MDYIETIQNVLDYIEENIKEGIEIEEIVKKVCLSKYHFYRIFTAIVGVPLLEYIRRRRLSEAAKKLLYTEERIIEIAFDFGFESQEAFTRAFGQSFSCSPARFRKNKPKIWFYEKADINGCKLSIKNKNGGLRMEIKTVEKGEIKIIGMKERINMPENTVPQLWQKFMRRSGEIKNVVPCVSYGIAENMEETKENYSFDEIVGLEVKNFEEIPEGMITKIIQPQKYIVVTHKGNLMDENGISNLAKTYDYIYGKWLPSSGYEVDQNFNFELYDERFKPNDPNSELDIYIPIK